ncbi:MAG: Rpn family recombination-promoting nuclease/putative transposase, partial [Muribaculaceae bacterium]|nr:Rpn family recombination-promoting nuclease/putative transposase [Muribaculaceae bacterium]
RLIQEFEWREKYTGESLTRKQRMLFNSLKQIPGDWEACDTDLQRSLYLIKNMDKMDKNSKAYRDGRYRDLFDSAESIHISAEDVVTYSQSLAHLREYQSGLDYRYEKGREEGIAYEKENMARKMKAAGIDINFISLITEIPLDRIREI